MAKLLEKYLEEKAEVVAESLAILDRAEDESRPLTEDEERGLEKLKADNERLTALISKEEGYRETRRKLAEVADGNRSAEQRANANDKKWESLGEMLQAVRLHATEGVMDRRLVPHAGIPTGQGERTASDGGFLVGMEKSYELTEMMYSLARIAPLCRTTEVGPGANGVHVISIDETSRANGSRYGQVLGYWKGEADTLELSKIKFRQEEIKLEKLTALMYGTDEIVEDATALESFMNDAVPEELAFRLDDAIIRGTGAGMPKGILNATDLLVTVAKETSQTALTINAENVKKMYSRLMPGSLKSAVWLVNQDCLSQLWSLRDSGLTYPQVQTNLGTMPPMMLLGLPVIPIEQCETLGTVGDIILFDPRQYRIVRKGRMKTDSSIHVRFLQQERCYRFSMRVNGQPSRRNSLTPFKGTNTIGTVVVLATRA